MAQTNGNYSHDLEANKLEGVASSDHNEASNNSLTHTITISPEQFERLYLNPKIAGASTELRKTFANPTPLGILGFAVGLFPLSIELMGWRGSGDTFGTPTTTCSIWYGGLLIFFAAICEFIIGNTFSFLVFCGFSAHFLTFSTTFIPWFAAVAWNSDPKPGNNFAPGPTFDNGLGFYAMALAMLAFVFLIGSLRTNLVFVLIFVAATMGFGFAAAGLWYTGQGQMAQGGNFIVATGACFFAADLLGWYLLLSMIITIMELPIPDLPVFDLSVHIKARSRAQQK